MPRSPSITSSMRYFGGAILIGILFPLLAFTEQLRPLEPAIKEIIKLTDRGPVPSRLILKKLDSSVFFVNTTKEGLLSLRVDFGERRIHCSGPGLQHEANGVISSQTPIAPKDYALMCFPEKGAYPVTIFGIPRFPLGVKALIVVEP